MMTLEASRTSYLSYMLDCTMTPRHKRHGLSERTKEITTLTISNGMFGRIKMCGKIFLRYCTKMQILKKSQ